VVLDVGVEFLFGFVCEGFVDVWVYFDGGDFGMVYFVYVVGDVVDVCFVGEDD